MNHELPCQEFIEEMTGSQPPSARLAEHLRACPDCRAVMATLRAMRGEASAFPATEIRLRRQGVLERLAPILKPGNQTEPRSREHPLMALLKGRLWPLALGFALLLLAAGISLWERSGRLPFPTDACLVTWQDGRRQPFPLGTPLRLEQGIARIAGPDGSTFEITAPVDIRIASRGFALERGTVRVEAKPGPVPFRGTTPYGVIEVLGTIFECHVSDASATVRVISGRVRVTGVDGASLIVEAGRTETFGRLRQPPVPIDPAAGKTPDLQILPATPSSPVTDLNGE